MRNQLKSMKKLEVLSLCVPKWKVFTRIINRNISIKSSTLERNLTNVMNVERPSETARVL